MTGHVRYVHEHTPVAREETVVHVAAQRFARQTRSKMIAGISGSICRSIDNCRLRATSRSFIMRELLIISLSFKFAPW